MKMSRGKEIRFAGPYRIQRIQWGDFWLGFNFSERKFIPLNFRRLGDGWTKRLPDSFICFACQDSALAPEYCITCEMKKSRPDVNKIISMNDNL